MDNLDIHYSDPKVLERLEWLAKARAAAVSGSWADGMAMLDEMDGINRPKEGQEKSMLRFRERIVSFLDNDDYLSAGTLFYPQEMFNAFPRHVQRLIEAITKYDKCILLGSSNLGKTYNAIAWLALDYWYDPHWTTVRAVSVTETNLRDNVWRKFVGLLSNGLFPLEVYKNNHRMILHLDEEQPEDDDEDSSSYGFRALLVGKSESSTSKVKGYHCDPFRKETHKKFGRMTRVRLLFDEAQSVPRGVTEDFGSPLSSINDQHGMKFLLALNPTDPSAWALQYAEPTEGGWDEKNMDGMYNWVSDQGWHVCRVDSRRTENIMQRKAIFPGFPVPGSEKQFFIGTEPGPNYYPFWAAWPTPGRAAEVIVPSMWFDQSVGEPTFTGIVQYFGSFDTSEGGDKAILVLGRYGVASGWRDADGKEQKFPSRKVQGETENRRTSVVDQVIELNPSDPATVGAEVRSWCEKYKVPPEHLAADKTGNGSPYCSWLANHWGPIVAVTWKGAASIAKILADDKETCNFMCKNIISEMAWCVRLWVQPTIHGLFINPVCKSKDRLRKQLTTRRYSLTSANGFVEIEDKQSWSNRNNQESPDEGDAVFMFTLAIRRNGMALPATSDETATVLDRRENRHVSDPYGDRKAEAKKTDHTTYEYGTKQSSWVEPALTIGQEVEIKLRR